MVRPSQRLFPFLRSGLRTNLVAHAPPRAVLARRMMSSHAGHSAGGDEKYWRVGSMLVFGPALFYLLSPAARNTAHKHTVEHEQHAEAVTAVASQEQEPPMTDDEGTAVSSEEVKASVERALTEDSPKSTQEDEGVAAETPSEPSAEPKPESASEGEKDDASEEPNPGPEVEAETEDSKKDAPADAQSEPEKPAAEQASAGES